MTTLTIPRDLAGTNLIAVPQSAYKEFLVWQKSVKSIYTQKATAKDLRELSKARKDYAAGKYVTLAQLKNELGSHRSRAR